MRFWKSKFNKIRDPREIIIYFEAENRNSAIEIAHEFMLRNDLSPYVKSCLSKPKQLGVKINGKIVSDKNEQEC